MAAAVASPETFDPLKLFQTDVRSTAHATVIQACKRLLPISLALGPSRTRNELFPFLLEFADIDNDEAQTEVARQLGEICTLHNGELIGGPSQMSTIFPLLEKLCGEEEFLVRDTATVSLNAIVLKMPKGEVVTKFVPLLKRLANGDWFTTRVSAVSMFPTVYPLLSNDPQLQTELRSLFTNLCNDDTPMVRKAAYIHLKSLLMSMPKQQKTELVNLVKSVCTDEMDSMRQYGVEGCVGLISVLETNDIKEIVLPLIEGLVDDQSWRVRQAVALTFHELVQSSNLNVECLKRLLVLHPKLIKDKQPEVRQVACSKLDLLASALSQHSAAQIVTDTLLPLLDLLAVDPVQNVRISFSATVVSLASVIGKDQAVKFLLPLIATLTKDEYYEVRNNIISKLDLLSQAIGVSSLSQYVLPVLVDMSKDPKWRVRQGVVEKTHLLAQLLGVKTWQVKIQPLLITALSDHVYSIRECACSQVGLICNEFGAKWVVESKFLTQAFVIYDPATNYLHRMTCLLCITEIINKLPANSILDPDLVDKHLLPTITQACSDEVANVRIAAAKNAQLFLNKCSPQQKSSLQSKLQPLLQKLTMDADVDVSYFAQQAIKRMSQ